MRSRKLGLECLIAGAFLILDGATGRGNESAAQHGDRHRYQGYQERTDHSRLLRLLSSFCRLAGSRLGFFDSAGTWRVVRLAEPKVRRSESIHRAIRIFALERAPLDCFALMDVVAQRNHITQGYRTAGELHPAYGSPGPQVLIDALARQAGHGT